MKARINEAGPPRQLSRSDATETEGWSGGGVEGLSKSNRALMRKYNLADTLDKCAARIGRRYESKL